MPAPPLLTTLARLLTPASGAVGLAARHVESGREWLWEHGRPFPAASLVKLPLLAAFWAAAERGAIDPAERVTLTAGGRVEGAGVLRALGPGLTPSWRDLATLMVTVSDNTATNLLIDRLGLAAIQTWVDAAGLGATRLGRRMMNTAAAAAGRDNWTSAGDMLALLAAIHASRCVSPAASAEMRRAIEAQQLQDKLGRRLPAEVRLANKTAWSGDVTHDAGVLTWDGGTLIAAVLTEGITPRWRASDLIGEVGEALVREAGGPVERPAEGSSPGR
jgi:beta-lactamase class A